MKKKIFILVILLGGCIILSFYNRYFALCLPVLGLYLVCVCRQMIPPKHRDAYKGRRLMEALEIETNTWTAEDEQIIRFLQRQTVRNLCHLQEGLKSFIFEWEIGTMMPMSQWEEKLTDRRINYYKHFLELVNKRLPKKYQY